MLEVGFKLHTHTYILIANSLNNVGNCMYHLH